MNESHLMRYIVRTIPHLTSIRTLQGRVVVQVMLVFLPALAWSWWGGSPYPDTVPPPVENWIKKPEPITPMAVSSLAMSRLNILPTFLSAGLSSLFKIY